MSETPSADLAEALLSAQVHYFKSLCLNVKEAELRLVCAELLAGFLDRPVRDILDESVVSAQYLSLWLESGLGDDFRVLLTEWLTEQHAELGQSAWQWQEVLTEGWVKMVAARLADQQALREELVAAVLGSAVYRKLISDVLYAGIRSFFQQDSLLSKVPALGSLMKLSRFGLGKVAPGLEELVEPLLKSFIEYYVETALKVSKDSLLSSLDGQKIRELADQIWQHVQVEPVAKTVALLEMADLESKLNEGEQHWVSVRSNEGTQAIVNRGVALWVEKMMGLPGRFWLSLFGLDEEGLSRLVAQMLKSLLLYWEQEGAFEAFLRQLLRPFYDAPEFHQALEAYAKPFEGGKPSEC